MTLRKQHNRASETRRPSASAEALQAAREAPLVCRECGKQWALRELVSGRNPRCPTCGGPVRREVHNGQKDSDHKHHHSD